MSDCIYCKIISGDLPAYKVYEDNQVLAFLDINPVSPGHTLIVPKIHLENCLQNTTAELAVVMKTMKKITPAILAAVGADSMNFTTNCGVASGQIIFHTHFHIIPRFAADEFKKWEPLKKAQENLEIVVKKIKTELEK